MISKVLVNLKKFHQTQFFCCCWLAKFKSTHALCGRMISRSSVEKTLQLLLDIASILLPRAARAPPTDIIKMLSMPYFPRQNDLSDSSAAATLSRPANARRHISDFSYQRFPPAAVNQAIQGQHAK